MFTDAKLIKKSLIAKIFLLKFVNKFAIIKSFLYLCTQKHKNNNIMARITINCINQDKTSSTEVIGKKMPLSWVRKHYGKYETDTYYYVKKKNEYGILWMTCSNEGMNRWKIWTQKSHATTDKILANFAYVTVQK